MPDADPSEGRGRPPRPRRTRLTRADLPADLTGDTVRRLGARTLRELARRDNGVLDAAEQAQFDAALAEVRRGTASLVEESLRRAQHAGPDNLDPQLRRSYQRTQQRLAEQVRRAHDSLPTIPEVPEITGVTGQDGDLDDTPADTQDDDASPGALAQQVEQTSETLDLLEKIASLQQQQLEHQESQLLSETRGLFFAFLVSVAVIIAGVAPLVDAEPHDRLVIVVWTVAVTVLAGLVYALVRWVQTKK